MRVTATLLFVLIAGALAPTSPRLAAQGAALSLGITANDVSLTPGETLTVGITVNNPGGLPAADFYLLLLLPDGQTVVSTGPGVGVRFGTVANLRTLVPIVRGVSLAGAFPYAASPFFSHTFTGVEPQGTYQFFFAAFRTGALDDGVIGAGELLAVASQSFAMSLSPAIVDTTRQSTSTIGPAGGSVQVTAADGTTLALTLPAGAVNDPTSITIAPLLGYQGRPAPFVTGLRAGPSRLRLSPPATLTITLPPGFQAGGFGLRAILTDESGGNLQDVPLVQTGNVVTLTVPHFSLVELELLLDFDTLACTTGATPFPPEQTAACNAIDPLADAEAVRLAAQGGPISQTFRTAVAAELQTWLTTGLMPRLVASQAPIAGGPFDRVAASLIEWEDWTSMYRVLFGLSDRTNQSAGRPFGQLVDQALENLRLSLLAAMNAGNLFCLGNKSQASQVVDRIDILLSTWRGQFGGAPVPDPFTPDFCLGLRVDAAPPPVLTPGQDSLMLVDVRLRFTDGVEFPGRLASVAISATNANVVPAGGVAPLPLATTVELRPTAATSVVTISASLPQRPNDAFGVLPPRTATFQAGQSSPVTISGTHLRTTATVTGTGAPPQDKDEDFTFVSGTRVASSVPQTTYPSGSANTYTAESAASIVRTHSTTGGTVVVGATGDLRASLSRQGTPSFDTFVLAQSDDAWCATLPSAYDLTPTSSGDVVDFEVRRSGTTFDLTTGATRRLAAGTWCVTFDAGITRRFTSAGGFAGPATGAFSYTVTLRPAP